METTVAHKQGGEQVQEKSGYLAAFANRIKRLGFIAAVLVFWQLFSTTYLDSMSQALLPPPTRILPAFWELIASGELLNNSLDSLKREFIAFLWALSAIPIAVAMSWWPRIGEQERQ